jgi:hypothetical protein
MQDAGAVYHDENGQESHKRKVWRIFFFARISCSVLDEEMLFDSGTQSDVYMYIYISLMHLTTAAIGEEHNSGRYSELYLLHNVFRTSQTLKNAKFSNAHTHTHTHTYTQRHTHTHTLPPVLELLRKCKQDAFHHAAFQYSENSFEFMPCESHSVCLPVKTKRVGLRLY